ncbi:MAG: hypothetical protein K6U80_05845 [Firmicutes bacterium]|nr:hypothetical protein [Bacillota bacterium]
MVKKHFKKINPDMEYSGYIAPSTGRVKRAGAGSGKATEPGSEDVEKNYGGGGFQAVNRGIEDEGEINPLVTGITKTNTGKNFKFGDPKIGNNQLENDNAGLNTDYNEAPPSTGDTTGEAGNKG